MARQQSDFASAGAGPGADFTVLSNNVCSRTGGVLRFVNASSVVSGIQATTVLETTEQYAEMVLTTNTGSSSGVFVGGSGSMDVFYLARHSGTVLSIFRANGTLTQLATVANTRVAGQVIRIEKRLTNGATALKAYLNGVELLSTTDATPLTSGFRAGIRVQANVTAVDVDNFDAGDLTALVASTAAAPSVGKYSRIGAGGGNAARQIVVNS